MSYSDPFISVLSSSSEAIIGFELQQNTSLNMNTISASWLGLVNSLWGSGITAFDLRFVKTASIQGVKIYLLCRVRPTVTSSQQSLHKYCLGAANHIQQMFQGHGYKMQSLFQEHALAFARQPFYLQAIAEIRRKEEVKILSHDYANAEFYVTYPWEWYCTNPLPYFDALQQQQGTWLVSVYVEPTRLSTSEEQLLNHASSSDIGDTLLEGGIQGKKMYETYTAFARRLERPYLLRISLAASTQQTLSQTSRTFFQWQNTVPDPVLQLPRYTHEHQIAKRNLSNLEWISWGNIRDHEPNSARLRYLTDSKGISMVFHLPSSYIEKLKVLIIFANPRQSTLLHLQREERLILEAIRSSRYRDNIEKPTILSAATIHDLSRALLEDNFHIVHIAGHGNEKGLLVLEDELGNPKPVPKEPLANLFLRYRNTIRCVLLNTCEGLDQGERISLGIPYTIAMEGSLDDNAALEFSRGFYEALGAGHEIDTAYEEGSSRASLAASGSRLVSKLFRTDE